MSKTIKLSDPINSYTSFEDGQVLTPGQLNGITEYLDRQDRLTRVRLSGSGIVCGFMPVFEKGAIRLSPGCGVTTDGDLLSLEKEKKLSFFRHFTDKNARYQAFMKGDKQIPLYELTEKALPDSKNLSSFDADANRKMADMVLLLYMESYYFDPDICTGSDCDNRGQRFENNLKFLLVSKADIGSIPDRDYFSLEDLAAERVFFDQNIKSYADLAGRYKSAVTTGMKDLLVALEKSYKLCAPLLQDLYPQGSPVTDWKKAFDKLGQRISGNAAGFQYLYCFILELMTAYNEFREALFHEAGCLIPPVAPFPKHLMLGSVIRDGSLPDPYRHCFYASPIPSGKAEGTERVRFLHLRIHRMISSFTIPATQGVRITPGMDCLRPLGERPIPWYYPIDEKEPINRAWSIELEERRKSNAIPSYNAKEYSSDDRVLNPLRYNTSCFSFFRVEGHLGMDFQEAEKGLKAIIRQFNLPVSVISLMVEKEIKLLPFKPPFRLGDLRITHYLYRRELGAHLKDLSDLNLKVDTMVKETGDPEPDESREAMKKVIKDSSGSLDRSIRAMNSSLSRSIADFDHEGFEKDYSEAIQTAAIMNKNIKGLTFNQSYTPYESFINATRFQGLKWIGDLLKRREDKAKEAWLFSNFIADHPGVEHLCGVGKGGTFMLVYSSSDKKVVADFALPYRYCPETKDDEVDESMEDGVKRPDWTILNDDIIKLNKGKILALVDKKMDLLDKGVTDRLNSEIGKLDFRITTQADSINKAFSGSVNTVIDTIFKGKTPGDFANPDFSGAAGAMEGMKGYAAEIDEKIIAGTATDAERKMRKDLDGMMGDIIKETVTKIGSRASDIAVGSEEERFIEIAGNSAALIKDAEVKTALAADMKNLGTAAVGAGKANLAEKVKVFGR